MDDEAALISQEEDESPNKRIMNSQSYYCYRMFGVFERNSFDTSFEKKKEKTFV